MKVELEEHGFGILSKIDVSKKFKNKLDVEFDKYVILGACNPEMAYKALQKEQELGLLLPCNFIVYKDDENVLVSAVKPSKMLEISENKNLKTIAEEVETDLKEIIENIS